MFEISKRRTGLKRPSGIRIRKSALKETTVADRRKRTVKSSVATPTSGSRGSIATPEELQKRTNHLQMKSTGAQPKIDLFRHSAQSMKKSIGPKRPSPKQVTKPTHRRVKSNTEKKQSAVIEPKNIFSRKGSREFIVDSPPRSPSGNFDLDITQKMCSRDRVGIHSGSSDEEERKTFSTKSLTLMAEEQRLELIKYIQNYFKTYRESPPTTLDFYNLGKLIGKGAFGKVLLGTHKLTGASVAIKTIDKDAMRKSEHNKRKVFQEIYILKKIRHPNIVRILEVFESSKHVLIVTEYCGGGDLLHFVKKKGRLTEAEAKLIFKQIIYGVRVCHMNGILHRDFKLDNILIDEQYQTVKVCDFGVSKLVKKGETIYDQCGTPAYLAPEIAADMGYEGYTVDIWSLGVLLYAMLCGTVPFKAPTMKDLHKLILKGKYVVPDHVSPQGRNLMAGMLNLIPKNRLTLKEIINHPWFTTPYKAEELNLPPRFVGKPDSDISRHSLLEDRCSVQKPIRDAVVALGFPSDHINKSLQAADLNHATASYYLFHEQSSTQQTS